MSMNGFRQTMIAEVGGAVFGYENMTSQKERIRRFAEESAETQQAGGLSREEAHAMIDYVYDRPVGVITQEIAGSGVTLYALAESYGVNLDSLIDAETRRILRKIDECRAKHAAKPSSIKAA